MAEYRSLGSTWMIFLHMFSLLNLVKPISFSTLAITFKCKYMSLANSLDNIFERVKSFFDREIFRLHNIFRAFLELLERVPNFMCTFKTIHSIEHTNAKRFRKRILSDSIGVYFFFIGLGEVVWPNQGFHSFICHSPNTNLLFLKSMTCEHTNMVSLYRQSGGLPISLLTSSYVILLDSREAKGPKMSHRL